MDSRSRFINSAARLYSTQSPATSAHLILQCRDEAIQETTANPPKIKVQHCGACSTILIPGLNADLTISSVPSKTQRLKTSSMRERPRSSTAVVETHCKRCRRFIRKEIGKETRLSKSRAFPAGKTSGSEAMPSTTDQTTRKRRKKTGLQAMLEQAKAKEETTKSALSNDFGLMDFMSSL